MHCFKLCMAVAFLLGHITQQFKWCSSILDIPPVLEYTRHRDAHLLGNFFRSLVGSSISAEFLSVHYFLENISFISWRTSKTGRYLQNEEAIMEGWIENIQDWFCSWDTNMEHSSLELVSWHKWKFGVSTMVSCNGKWNGSISLDSHEQGKEHVLFLH